MPVDQADQRPSLLIATDCSYHGTFNVAWMIAVGLRDAFEVTLALPQAEGKEALLPQLGPFAIRCLGTEANFEQLERSAYDRVEAARILDEARPDVVLCCDGAHLFSLLALKDVAAERHIPVLMIVNILSDDALERFEPFAAHAKRAIARVATLIFVSEALRTRFNRLVDSSVRNLVIPNFCRPEFLEPGDPSARSRLRRDLAIPMDALVFCTIGRIDRNKGQHLSLAALEQLKPRGHACYWLFVGRIEPWERDGFESALRRSQSEDCVRVLGERPDVRDLLDASDVLVLTSLNEGMPLVIIEALSRGLPVLATAIDGVVEQIDETCGVLLPSPGVDEAKTVTALTDAVEGLNSDRARLDAMRIAARRRAEHFRSDKAISTYREALVDVVSARDDRGSASRPPNEVLKPGSALDLTDPASAWNYLARGWTPCTAAGTSSDGALSTIRLRFAPDVRSVRLNVVAAAHDGCGQYGVYVFRGSERIGRWKIGKKERSVSLDLDLERTGREFALRLVYDRTDRYGRAIRVRRLVVEARRRSVLNAMSAFFGLSFPARRAS